MISAPGSPRSGRSKERTLLRSLRIHHARSTSIAIVRPTHLCGSRISTSKMCNCLTQLEDKAGLGLFRRSSSFSLNPQYPHSPGPRAPLQLPTRLIAYRRIRTLLLQPRLGTSPCDPSISYFLLKLTNILFLLISVSDKHSEESVFV